MKRATVVAFLLGWGIAVILSPRDVVGWFRKS